MDTLDEVIRARNTVGRETEIKLGTTEDGESVVSIGVHGKGYHTGILDRDLKAKVVNRHLDFIDGLPVKELLRRIESCDFECEAGPLENNLEWQRLKKLLG